MRKDSREKEEEGGELLESGTGLAGETDAALEGTGVCVCVAVGGGVRSSAWPARSSPSKWLRIATTSCAKCVMREECSTRAGSTGPDELLGAWPPRTILLSWECKVRASS